MRKILFILLLIVTQCPLSAQEHGDNIKYYFDEVNRTAGKYRELWDKDLYGPFLLIDPGTRAVYANVNDMDGNLEAFGQIYTGYFPEDRVFANTAIEWGGIEWAMIMLPLPEDTYDRIGLMIHERFHVLQPELGFELHNTLNAHLNEMEGRIFLRLELEALRAAAAASTDKMVRHHLKNALAFRKHRHSVYPGAPDEENKMELNEGLAEYTGEAACGRPEKEKARNFSNKINAFYNNPSFSRSFAYQTIPIYGYLLDRYDAQWNKKIGSDTDMTDFFIDAFEVGLTPEIIDNIMDEANDYNGGKIIDEEEDRAREMKKIIDDYRRMLISEPHLTIGFESMQIQFDPRNVVPLDDAGSVYPILNVIDNWGVLTVTKAALINTSWTSVTLPAPRSIDTGKASGDGWDIELKDGYVIIKDEATGNYSVSKRDNGR